MPLAHLMATLPYLVSSHIESHDHVIWRMSVCIISYFYSLKVNFTNDRCMSSEIYETSVFALFG